jgi:hypothetical protein
MPCPLTGRRRADGQDIERKHMPFRSDKSFSKYGFYTATGKALLINDPRPEHMDIIDIGISLARQCRFGGNQRIEIPHYSVAQHSVIVSEKCYKHARAGLLHDSQEFGVSDVTRPMSRAVESAEFDVLKRRWSKAIGDRFGIELIHLPGLVKIADNRALATEIRDMYYDVGHEVSGFEPYEFQIRPLGVVASFNLFMMRACELSLCRNIVTWEGLVAGASM